MPVENFTKKLIVARLKEIKRDNEQRYPCYDESDEEWGKVQGRERVAEEIGNLLNEIKERDKAYKAERAAARRKARENS